MIGEGFNSITVESMREKGGVKWTKYEADVIPLWIADPDISIAMKIKTAILKAVDRDNMFYYDDEEIRRVIARKVTEKNGIETSPEDVMVTQGVLPLMWLAIKYACKAGDNVVLTDPMFECFWEAVEATGVKPLHWKLKMEEGYHFDADALNKLITPKTRLIFLCNPHNPSSRVMTEEELRMIGEVAVDHDLTIMSDELWEDIVFDGRRHVSIASLSPEFEERTITTYGFSKTYGLSGLRIGYMVATNREMMKSLRRRSETVLRTPSTLALAAASAILQGDLDKWREGFLAHLSRIKSIVEERFQKLRIPCPGIEGTYLAFPDLSRFGMKSEEIAEYLLSDGKIAVTPGTVYGPNGEGHVRLCIATSERIIVEALERMELALERLYTRTT